MYLSPSAQSVPPTQSYRKLLQNIKYRLCLLLNTHLQPSHIHTYTQNLATNHQWKMLHRTLSSRQTAGGHRGQTCTSAPQRPSRPSPQKSYRHSFSYCNYRNQLHIIRFHAVYIQCKYIYMYLYAAKVSQPKHLANRWLKDRKLMFVNKILQMSLPDCTILKCPQPLSSK